MITNEAFVISLTVFYIIMLIVFLVVNHMLREERDYYKEAFQKERDRYNELFFESLSDDERKEAIKAYYEITGEYLF